jgi:gliding motility-associated-like protein
LNTKFSIDTINCNATLGGIHGLTISGGTNPYTYAWFDQINPGTPVSTNLNLTDVPTGKYMLIVTDKNGCQDRLTNVMVPTKGSLVAHLSADPNIGVAPLHVIATTTTTGTNYPQGYVWYLDGQELGKTDSKTNTFPFNNIPFGNHVIQVTVTDSNKCKSVDYITIAVLTDVKITDVNIFTPNDDGHNDILLFPSEGLQSLQGTIYDRWGLQLFEWSDAEKGWDGNNQSGNAVPEGTYYYILRTTDVFGGSRVKAGFVELIRK